VAGIHTGCIQSGSAGSTACGDRSLLDFFQLVVDRAGKANIIYVSGQLGSPINATSLFFVKQN
jgi:hypothetical protein